MPGHKISLGQLSHINALPSETLSFIFVTIVDASLYARSIGDDSYGTCEYPTLISSVCAHWRRVSIGTPHLWTYIDLMPSNEHMRNLEHVKLWLERSQSLSLRLRLGNGGEHHERNDNSFMMSHNSPLRLDGQLASILLSAAPRVQSFTLKFDYPDFGAGALSALLPEEGEHPIRELAIRQGRWATVRTPNLSPQSEWGRLLEPLHALHLERSNIKLDTITCRNLVELQLMHHIGFPPIAGFVQVLESNPGLCTLVLDSSGFGGMYSPPDDRQINLPSLRYVYLAMDHFFVTWLLKVLVPGLHELDLRLGYIAKPVAGDTRLVDNVISFFQRARVKSLLLQAGGGIQLFPVLASLPHLQRLDLSSFDFDPSTFAGLEPDTDILPKLHTINLNRCTLRTYLGLYPGLRALLSLPSVRRIGHLDCGPGRSDELWKRFIELLEGGGFAATVVYASQSDFENRSSPFR